MRGLKVLFFLFFSVSLFATNEVELVYANDAVGVTVHTDTHEWQGADLKADSIDLFYTCDPYRHDKDLYKVGILEGDTLWFDSKDTKYLIGFAYVYYPIEWGPWVPAFTNGVTIKSIFESTNTFIHQGQDSPRTEMDFPNPSGTDFHYQVQSNAKTVRIMIYSNYGMPYYKNHNGPQYSWNTYDGSIVLPKGAYWMVVRSIYTDQCKGSFLNTYNFIVN